MFSWIVLKRDSISSKATVAFLGIILCILLPQFFHLIGLAAGVGNRLGTILLPMYLPVVFVGLFSGSVAGLMCGLLSPVVSMLLTGMPDASMLLYMTIELAVFGATSGALSKAKMPVWTKVLCAQAAGRLSRFLVILAMVVIARTNTQMLSATLNLFVQGVPGILLQLLVLPPVIKKLEKMS